MSRHRIIRNINYEDEGYNDDDDYSQSDDSYCISPSTADQFMYNRDRGINLSSYMGGKAIPEEEEGGWESEGAQAAAPADHQELSDQDRVHLLSCVEEVNSALGYRLFDAVVTEAVLRYNFNVKAALKELRTYPRPKDADAPKSKRNRKKRNQTQAATNGQGTGSEDDPGEQPHHPAAPRPPVVTVATPRDSAQVGFEVADGLSEAMGAASLDPSLTGQTAPQRQFKSALSKMLQRSYKKKIKCKGQGKNDKIDIKAEYAKRQCGRELLNLVVIGHVDAGKSTVMGHVLFQLGCVQKRTMHKYEQESRKMGKSSFAYAWVLDETDEERSRGVTMDVAQTRFVTDSKLVTLLDAPGHKDFIPNMITGAAQADVAILVVNATRGEFETGFDLGGQTREHALLARSLGVSQIIVAVNKMDTVSWDQGRYEEIVAKLQQFLKQVGFKDRDLSYIPCSGLNGENLTKPPTAPELCNWYSGPSLLAQIDQFRSPERPMDKPLRVSISDVFKSPGGLAVSGKVNAGYLQAGDRVLVMPSGDMAAVKNIVVDDMAPKIAFAGDHVTFSLTNIDMTSVSPGFLLCDPKHPTRSAVRIRAKIVVFSPDQPITKGMPIVFHYQSVNEPAVFKRLVATLNKSTGEVIKNRPKCLTKNGSAIVEIEFERSVCVELYSEYRDLGRFMLRTGGHTIAAGLIEEIVQTKLQQRDDQ